MPDHIEDFSLFLYGLSSHVWWNSFSLKTYNHIGRTLKVRKFQNQLIFDNNSFQHQQTFLFKVGKQNSAFIFFTHFRALLQNLANLLVHFLEELKSRKIVFEIFWPLIECLIFHFHALLAYDFDSQKVNKFYHRYHTFSSHLNDQI